MPKERQVKKAGRKSSLLAFEQAWAIEDEHYRRSVYEFVVKNFEQKADSSATSSIRKISDDESRFIDAVHEQFKANWNSFNNRRSYEWKVCLGLWTALAALVAIVLTNELRYEGISFVVSSYVFAVFIVLMHGLWLNGILQANWHDQRKAYAYEGLIRNRLAISLEKRIIDAENQYRNFKNHWYARLWHWSPRTQLAITFLLALFFIILLHMKTPRNDVNDGNADVDQAVITRE